MGRGSITPPPCGYESPDDIPVPTPLQHRDVFCQGPTPTPGSTPDRSPDPESGIRSPEPHSNTSSLNHMITKARNLRGSKVGIKDRIACFRWTWFTMTMATGGVANVISSLPYRSHWLTGIGLAFFFFNLCLFAINTILILMRFRLRPGSFLNSFTDQFEIATIFITICQYGIPKAGPWLLNVMEVMFWIYVSLSMVISATLYLTLWSTQVFPVHTMTPVWVFPAYPLLLTAPFGSNLIAGASKSGQLASLNAVAIAVASITVQGTGYLISFMVCAAFLYRLMTQKLPRDAQRPGIFISIGPSAFTAAGIVQLGNQTADIFPTDFMETEHAIFILRLLSYMAGLWLYGLSIWFFLVSAGSLWKYVKRENRNKMPFQMTWFSFVFPNTALVTATEALGSAFESNGLKIFGCVLAACIVAVWIFVFTSMVRCLWRQQL
ncbi:voltage-dependent anion channel-domain-containing protein [Cercophora newfieldiana]|uniref:Voltage-dependent anion channel-domain-containing protein n=1 Tax=Cercophora newfieldiana TaxID=92897 RepID=A0AA39YIJ3_9PEZI|nr:voltage-dependent anion channel-domain-containing protein [Cercophora newfieldiana]